MCLETEVEWEEAQFTYFELFMLNCFFFLPRKLIVAVSFQVHEISPKSQLWIYYNFLKRYGDYKSLPNSSGDN